MLGLRIWLLGSASARYPASVERMIKDKLVAAGIFDEMIICLAERWALPPALDTVQEAMNIMAVATNDGVSVLYCVSNRLQLWQIRGLLRRQPLRLVLTPTPLRDWRWWYVAVRVALIPLAFVGVGQRFPLLILTRWARKRFAAWPF